MDYSESPERLRREVHADFATNDPLTTSTSRAPCSIHDASSASMSGLSDLWSDEMDTSVMDNAVNERLLNLTQEEEYDVDGDAFNRAMAIVGRQLAVIGDDINELYAPHFREATGVLEPNVLCSCITSAVKSFVRRRCHWLRECMTSSAPKVVHFLSEIVLRVQRTAEKLQEDLRQYYSQCSMQWKAVCNHVERTTHVPMAGFVMVTVAMATFAAITFTVESGV